MTATSGCLRAGTCHTNGELISGCEMACLFLFESKSLYEYGIWYDNINIFWKSQVSSFRNAWIKLIFSFSKLTTWQWVEKTVEKKVWFSNQVLSVSKTRNFTLSEYVYIILSYSIFIERFRLKQQKKSCLAVKKTCQISVAI